MAKRPSHAASPEPDDYQSFLRRLLTEAHKPLKLDQILRMAHVPRHRKREVEATLAELAREGQVVRLHGGLWMAAELLRVLVGRYGVQRSGAGFVAPQAEEGTRGTGGGGKGLPLSVFIAPTQTGNAWHGDMVRVALLPGKATGKNPEGRIVDVVERGHKELTVRALKPMLPGDTGSFWCRPADPRFSFNMQVDVAGLERLPQRGDLLLVRVGEQLASDLWTGTAHAVFGREDDVAVQEQLVKLNHLVPLEFPQAALQEAASLPPDPRPEDYAGREDVRPVPFVTIDGRTARDFDDAVHVQRQGKGWLLRVGIADVTHYVRPRSALDMEARDRANSWYFPVSVEPMLPPALSNGLCSLNPQVDRLVMLAEVFIGPDGQPGDSRFAAAVLRSAARLTYGQVKRLVLDNGGQGDEAERAALLALPRGDEVLPMLEEAQRLARVLAQRRTERGTLDFNVPEPQYFFDDEGRITNIGRKQRHFAHQIIEEFMIAANEAVARFLEERGMPFLYRVHPEPDPARLEGLFRTLASTEVATALPPRPNAQSLQGVLRAAHGGSQEFLVGRLALRTMPQARYQPENEGHFGLASPCYCHFTSPIRRYADVVVHRALKRALGLDPGAIPAAHKLLALGDQCNRREREAMEAEREMARRLGTLVLRDRVGEEFPGIIAGVTDFGFFVELDAMPVEGMVRIADLGDDYFEFDPEQQALTGVMSGVRFALGQTVRTRLVEVNPGRLEITLALLEMPAPTAGRRGRERGPGMARRKGAGGQGARPAGAKPSGAQHKGQGRKKGRSGQSPTGQAPSEQRRDGGRSAPRPAKPRGSSGGKPGPQGSRSRGQRGK